MKTTVFVVQLFGEDGTPLPELPGLYAIVRPFLERELDRPLAEDETPLTVVWRIPGDAASSFPGAPANAAPEYGYLTILLMRDKQIVYRHPHLSVEVIAAGLPVWLEGHAPRLEVGSFAIRAADDSLLGNAPPVQKQPPPSQSRDKPTFRIQRIEETPPPLRRRDTLVGKPIEDIADEPTDALVRAYLSADVYRALSTDRKFSLDVEEGGFLFGRVYRDEEAQERYLVEITHAVQAEHTGASLLHLTFSGESFASMRRQLRATEPEIKLVGWYHTHLFRATASFGLSGVDDELHFTTFRIPWQVAGLVNIDAARDPAGRVLRFYVKQQGQMVRCPLEVLS